MQINFFSKHPDGSVREKSVDEIINDLKNYGEEKVEIFKAWLQLFEGGENG